MHINSENFISARYIDNEKKHVEILYKDGEQTLGHVIGLKNTSLIIFCIGRFLH